MVLNSIVIKNRFPTRLEICAVSFRIVVIDYRHRNVTIIEHNKNSNFKNVERSKNVHVRLILCILHNLEMYDNDTMYI